jgi:hypothetical protein
VPAFFAYFQVRGFHADQNGQRRDLRGDVHESMHVVELTPCVTILDAQPVLASLCDDLEFLVVRDIESLGPSRIDAGVFEIPLGKQVHLAQSMPPNNPKKHKNR